MLAECNHSEITSFGKFVKACFVYFCSVSVCVCVCVCVWYLGEKFSLRFIR